MQIKIFKASKKTSSTAIPSGGVSVSGELKQDTSITDPVFRISGSLLNKPYEYNMIQALGRYYFVTDWTYRGGQWEASCRTDVLASFKSVIGSTSMYCMRAANRYDGRVQDNMYPTFHATSAVQTASSPFYQAEGYVIGVVGPANTSQAGSVTYYFMGKAALTTLMTNVLGQTNLDDAAGWGNLGHAVRAALLNPVEYIVSCTYVPFQPTLGSSVNTIYYGWWSAATSNTWLLGDLMVTNLPDMTVSIPKHPQINSKGVFVQNAPYSRFELQVNPFGIIPLDGSLIQDSDHLRLTVKVDNVTGMGILEVFTVFQDNTERFLTRITAQVGVPVQLSQESANLSAIVNAGTQIAEGAVTGGAVGAAIGAVSSVGSLSDMFQPSISTTGANGSRAGLSGLVKLHATFYTIAAGDDANEGRPLLEALTPSSIGGYMQMLHCTVPLTAGMTEGDLQQIKAYVEGGFYYE